ncbi:MAG: long-chain fatty acid--CoA ligase, partial [Streptosporangiaceae bacterium]
LRHGATWHGGREVVTAEDEQTTSRVSYEQIGAGAAQLAHALRQLGVDGDDRVGTYLWNNREHLEAYLAVPAMGAVLHTANIRLFVDELVQTVNLAQDRVLLVDADLLDTLAPALGRMPTVRAIIVRGQPVPDYDEVDGVGVYTYDELVRTQPGEFSWPGLDERTAAAICFTSGTTGNPKGVAYSHRSIYLHALSLCTANAVALSAYDRGLIVVPMFHANAWGYPHATFWCGGDLILPHRFLKPDQVVPLMERERPTFANGVPTIWIDVLRYLREHPDADVSSITRVVVGGSATPRALMQAFRDEYDIPLLQGWGMTETSPLVTLARPRRGHDGSEALEDRLSQGRVLPGVELRLVHPENDTRVPHDGRSIGELELRGPWISASYLSEEDPAKFHDGWLRTGDIGTVDPDGYVRLTDRAKDAVKSGGEWISSIGLEAEVSAHPDVIEAAVIGVPDDRWGERPCVIVTTTEGSTVTAEDLRDFLDGQVARWWLPEHWVFAQEIPRTSVGKYDKLLLRTQYAAGELTVVELGPRRPAARPLAFARH